MLAIWGPTLLFFPQGFEHAVVNMFLIPVGMLLGAKVSLSSWRPWNQIPVTLGNLVGGMVFTGLAIYCTHHAVLPASAEGRHLSVLPQPNPSGDPTGSFASL